MKSFCPLALSWIALYVGFGTAVPTWPSAIDELEDVMFLNTGYRSRGFGALVTPCSTGLALGRNTAAEWLRLGFHDMSTTNTFFAPHGGIDSSLAYELNSGENIGAGFESTFVTYGGFLNSRLSTSDLVALGVYASVRGCGGPVIPIRGGRVDVFAAGPIGVPQPQNGIGTFTNQFARMGFTATEMIQMTACGHTLGGVHAGNFPNIVTVNTAPNDYQLMDASLGFDNAIATRYINGPDTDPLSVGPATASGRNSDFVVFNSDKNVTLKSMTSATNFSSICTTILQKMIDTVDPSTVTLTDPIQPYDVKPTGLQLTLLSGGASLQFAGDIRVRTTTRSADQIASVQLAYKDRTGATVSTPIVAAAGGTASGFDDSFTFYSFSATISSTTSISSFNVLVNLVGGTTETYDNNGSGYPISDSVIIQTPQSCLSSGNLTVVAAVRSTVNTPVNMTVTEKVAPTGGSPIASPLPSLKNSSVIMIPGATYGPYKLFSGSFSIVTAAGTKYGAQSGSFSDTFKDASGLGSVCTPFGSAPSSTSTTQSSTATSSTASPTTTLGHRVSIGSYSFQGCYTEGDGVRALAGASFYNYTAMSLEMCASNCNGFSYFGVEYGGECYCGNTLGAGSDLATLGDCSFICPGNSLEYCGAGNRLEMYKLASLVTSTSASSTSPSSLSTSSSIGVRSTSSSFGTSSTSSTKTSSSSSTSTTPTTTPSLHIVPSAGLYNYFGCYTEGTNVRALGAASFPSDTNSVEACVASCSPYKYAGMEYGRECWCADSFGTGSIIAPDSDCSMTCAGNQYEYCGAGNRLSVYIKNGTTGGPSSSSSRSVSSSSSSTSKSSTSTSKSVSSTSSSSSKSSTSTSKSVSSTSSTKTSTSTSSTKTSSTTLKTTTPTTSSSSSSATPTQTAPAIKPTVGTYTYYGCQTEGTNVRALSGAVSFDYTAMTLEECAASCSSYTYWGVEYGGECYCGNSFGTGSVKAGDTDCSFTCPGNGLEYCGAGNRLSVYVKK